MKSGTCPKCKATEVFRNPSGTRMSFKSGRSYMESSFDTYVCIGCGYMEMFVNLKGEDPNRVEDMRKSWKKIAPKG